MEMQLQANDGTLLRGREWPCPDARGTIVIVHGLGEHIGRYAHVAAFLNRKRWHVVGFDQRGHGTSGGARGVLATGDDQLADLATVVDAARAGSRGPLVLLGHSLGGLVAARFVAAGLEAERPAWQRDVDALVLSSPVLDNDMTPVQRALLAVLGRLAPNLAVGNGIQPSWISRDADVVAAYIADPLVHDRIAPRLARFVVDGGPAVRALAPRWRVPTLLLYAGSDRCVRPAGSAAFAAAAPPAVVTAHEFSTLFHEIFNEPEQAEVFSVLGAWLDTLVIRSTRNPR
ncbi:MAG: lysophospholipase [Caldimonas sp.]